MEIDINDPRLQKVERSGPGWLRIDYFLHGELVLTHFNGSVPVTEHERLWRTSRAEVKRQAPDAEIWRPLPRTVKG